MLVDLQRQVHLQNLVLDFQMKDLNQMCLHPRQKERTITHLISNQITNTKHKVDTARRKKRNPTTFQFVLHQSAILKNSQLKCKLIKLLQLRYKEQLRRKCYAHLSAAEEASGIHQNLNSGCCYHLH